MKSIISLIIMIVVIVVAEYKISDLEKQIMDLEIYINTKTPGFHEGCRITNIKLLTKEKVEVNYICEAKK